MSYILNFRAPLRTLLERKTIIDYLQLNFPQINLVSIDLDDKQFVLKIHSSERIEHKVQQSLLDYGHRVSFVSVVENGVNPSRAVGY